MTEPTLATQVSGDQIQHSAWNVMLTKIQSTVDGHRHDGVGSFGPLTNFSNAQFNNISANQLFVASALNLYGPVNLSGNLGAINISAAGTLTVAGNASFGGTLVTQSGFTAGVINAPGNLSASGVVSQIVAGSNITVSGVSGVGVVAVGVGGTTVFAGTNQSFGTVVQGSSLVQNTLSVSGQTALNALTVTNVSNAGSEFLQSRLTANDAVITNNLSAGTAFVSSSFTVGGPVNFSQGLQISNISANTLVVGSAQISDLANMSRYHLVNTNTSAGDFRFFNMSAGRAYITLNATNASAIPDVSGNPGWLEFYDNITATSATWALQMTPTSGVVNTLVTLDSSGMKLFGNLSATGSLQLQSRMLANDAVVTGNFSAGSLYGGSSILLNYSSNVAIIASAQIAQITNLSRYTFANTNTSVGNFRIFSNTSGRTWLSLNAPGAGTATTDISGIAGILEFFDQLSGNTQVAYQYVTSGGGSLVTLATLNSAGLQLPGNFSAGSLVTGSAQATNLSTNTLVTGSAQAGWLVNTSMLISPNMSTNQSAGNYRQFSLSSGRTYSVLNTINASAIPDVSGNPMLLEYMDNLSGSQQFTWQFAATSGTIGTYAQLTPAAFTISTGIRHIIRTTTASTNTSANDYLIFVNQSSVSMAVTLAAAQSSIGQDLVVYANSGTGTVTIFTNANEQIGLAGNVSSQAVSNNTVARLIGYNNSTWLNW